jgi:hypothetical protein
MAAYAKALAGEAKKNKYNLRQSQETRDQHELVTFRYRK